MFGYVQANVGELTKAQRSRYQAIYCGVCHQIRERSGQLARLGLSYDMAFLSLLLMSLYEPEETSGRNICPAHPVGRKNWVSSPVIAYAADMNVALAYYNALDDYADEHRAAAKCMSAIFGKDLQQISSRYPRQCQAMKDCIRELGELEKANCPTPDAPASCFGKLMGELLVYQEDMWAPTLRQMGMALGRFVYLADAMTDYKKDRKKKQYNPFLAMDAPEDPVGWEQYLVLAMGRCTDYYERLPLVQDKDVLDNILYSGVWVEYRRRIKGAINDRGSL